MAKIQLQVKMSMNDIPKMVVWIRWHFYDEIDGVSSNECYGSSLEKKIVTREDTASNGASMRERDVVEGEIQRDR